MYRVILRHSIVWIVLRNVPLNRLIELRIVSLNRWMVLQIQLFKCRNVPRPVASRNASRLRRTHERPFRNGVTQQTLGKQDGFHDITQSGRLNKKFKYIFTNKMLAILFWIMGNIFLLERTNLNRLTMHLPHLSYIAAGENFGFLFSILVEHFIIKWSLSN
jgi:hypothetical protein